jgi:triacylglycerol lipase
VNKAKRIAVLLAAIVAGASPTAAQVTPEIRARLDEIGRTVDTLATGAIYAPLQTRADAADFRIERDISYGSHAKQGLDVIAPAESGSTPLPVLIMVHGGGFVAGDKTLDENGQASAFYDNIMLWAASNGMVGVNANYRLAPEFRYPAVQEDLGAVVRWVQQNIGQYGGDPQRIMMMGHSAGAAHVANYVATAAFGPDGEIGITKAVFSSASYDFAPPHAYFGDEATGQSSIAGLVATETPYMVIVAENDPAPFHVQAGKLMEAVCSTGSCPPFLVLKDHNHMSGVYSINSADTSMSGPILAFLQQESDASD